MSDLTTNERTPDRLERGELRVSPELASFVEEEALPGTGVDPAAFWAGLSTLAHDFGPRNAALLRRREALQAEIDSWHVKRQNQPHVHKAYKAFLGEIGFLLPRATTSPSRPRTWTPRSRPCPALSWSCRSPMLALR